jgi:hypothetical protein
MGIEFNEGGHAWEGTETVLRRRGHVILARGDPEQALFPENRIGLLRAAYSQDHGGDETQRILGDNAWQRYVDLYGRNSFRKMLRWLVVSPERAANKDELAAIAGRRADEYVEYLEALGVIAVDSEVVRLARPLRSMGPSLEQYVRWLCSMELRGHAEWGVGLEGVAHGDFDVIAWLPPTVVYFECKAGAPADIEADSLRQMLRRTEDLSPDLTILVVDTEDDISPVCEKFLAPPAPSVRVLLQPDAGGIHYGVFKHWPVYAVNARPSILTQLRRCCGTSTRWAGGGNGRKAPGKGLRGRIFSK